MLKKRGLKVGEGKNKSGQQLFRQNQGQIRYKIRPAMLPEKKSTAPVMDCESSHAKKRGLELKEELKFRK